MSKQQGPMELGQLRDRVAVVTGAGNHGIGWGRVAMRLVN